MKSRTLSVDNEDERSNVDEGQKDAQKAWRARGAHRAHKAGRDHRAQNFEPAHCILFVTVVCFQN